MKFHRHVKRIENRLTVKQKYCQNNGNFGNNTSDVLRELIRFLASEDVKNPKVGLTNNPRTHYNVASFSATHSEFSMRRGR